MWTPYKLSALFIPITCTFGMTYCLVIITDVKKSSLLLCIYLQAHAACYQLLPSECSFGCLREIMLPPFVLTTPRMDVPVEITLGFPKKPTLPVSEEFSSSGDSKTEEDRDSDKRSPKEKEKEREKEEGG